MTVLVIGGGPAGMMAAIKAKQTNPDIDVVLLEKNEKLGKKLFITGKGRCNVTNDCGRDAFFNAVVTNPKFLFASYAAFDCSEAINFFNSNGCPLKTERGSRVFPVSDKSSDVLKCFERVLKKLGVKISLNTNVTKIAKVNAGFIVNSTSGEYLGEKLIIATGGNYYRLTGSTGDGYVFAENFGLKVVEPKPSLVGLVTAQKHDLAGLSLKNVSLKLFAEGKKVAEEFGEMLFTHNGLSGPTVLTLSTKFESDKKQRIEIDLKSALDEETLDKRILKDFSLQKNKELKNSLNMLLPESLAQYVVKVSGINPSKQINTVTLAERKKLLKTLKGLSFDIAGVDNPDTAIITRGGVDVKQIDPKTMQCKNVEGLFICGELLDVDAVTGGFNIQIALSSGAAAGVAAAKEYE